MGQEIEQSHFHKQDFARFRARLDEETELLRDCFARQQLSERHHIAGFELEGWLVDPEYRPAARNLSFIDHFPAKDLVSAELASFNIEFNTPPLALQGDALSQFEASLQHTWQQAERVAAGLDCAPLMIGILPTVSEADLCLANMTPMKRYQALNEQVLRLRQGRPLQLDIHGQQPLHTTHHDVMLEAAATSFQLHLQITPSQGARYYNAAKILSAPLCAISANSPLLFGHQLWAETRIPLFEQAVAMRYGQPQGPHNRVTFGQGYVEQSLLECFLINRDAYEVLLPIALDDTPEHFSHLLLHNGTIWRWNRPLIGFDADGTPHLRIEHRPLPAGPTIPDMIANAALFYGLIDMLANTSEPPEQALTFDQASANFYACARHGLAAEITWLHGGRVNVAELLADELLPLARQGLLQLGIDPEDANHYLGIASARLHTRQNGSTWQQRYLAKHGPDMPGLTAAYHARQRSGQPVHRWPV